MLPQGHMLAAGSEDRHWAGTGPFHVINMNVVEMSYKGGNSSFSSGRQRSKQ